MPRLSVVHAAGGPVVIQDPSGLSAFNMTIDPTETQVADISAEVLGRIEDMLNGLQTAGKITWSVIDDPSSVADDSYIATVSDGAIGTLKLANGAVTKAKAKVYFSAERTGTGAAESIAHGLAATPSVLVVPTAGHDGAGAAGDKMPVIAEGSHTATDVVVTVSLGAKYKVFAWA